MGVATEVPRAFVPIPLPGKDYELRLPKGHLSVSQIELYLRCPEQYRRRYVAGEPDQYTAAQAEGSILAAVLEQLAVHRFTKGDPPSLEQARKWYVKHHKAECKEVRQWGEQTPLAMATRGELFLRNLYASGDVNSFNPIAVNGEPAAELEVKLPIAGVPMLGYVDLATRNRVWDTKVQSGKYFLKPDTSLQLSYYCVALGQPESGYIFFDKKSGKIEWIEARTRDLPKTKLWLEITVSRVAMAISQGHFPVCNQSNNNLCSQEFCAYWHDCAGVYV